VASHLALQSWQPFGNLLLSLSTFLSRLGICFLHLEGLVTRTSWDAFWKGHMMGVSTGWHSGQRTKGSLW
jgi:hypothetical protein